MSDSWDPLNSLYEGVDKMLYWGGRPIWKNPVDLVIYQEIVREVRPTLVIETGTHLGGSAEFWHEITHGRVITVDVDQQCKWPPRAAVVALEGSSTDPRIRAMIKKRVRSDDRVLVNLDSSHTHGHVTEELDAYSKFVTSGSYLIVEDGIDDLRYGRIGARQAVIDWLPDHPEFIADAYRERTGITNCPLGFLRRIS